MRARWIKTFAAMVMLAATAAQAQTALPDARVAERLSCLVRSRPLPDFKASHAFDDSVALLRVKLTFTHRDYAPRVEMLHATGDARRQELVKDYLLGYRLPCLKDGDPVVQAVQEFRVGGHAAGENLVPVGARQDDSLCIVQSARPVAYFPERAGRRVQVIVHGAFKLAADQPPEVAVVYNNGGMTAENAVRQFLAGSRMPCRKAGDEPVTFEQTFVLFGDERVTHVVAPREVGLVEFLGLVKDKHLLKARFDLNSMNCPFKVKLALRQPTLPNAVNELGRTDLNRSVFLEWLASLTPQYTDQRQAEELFNAELRIAVPCGTVEL